MYADSLVRLLGTYAAARGIAITSACVYAARQARLADRLRAGCTITARRTARVAQWLSDHWPAGAEWPPDIPRPEPQPCARKECRTCARRPISIGSETPERQISGQAQAPGAIRIDDPVAAARAAFDRMVDATNRDERHAAAAEAFAIGARLNEATGRIACPAALCAALGVGRSIYYDAIRRHRDGQPARPGSAAARMVAALKQAGDVRFAAASTKQGTAA